MGDTLAAVTSNNATKLNESDGDPQHMKLISVINSISTRIIPLEEALIKVTSEN